MIGPVARGWVARREKGAPSHVTQHPTHHSFVLATHNAVLIGVSHLLIDSRRQPIWGGLKKRPSTPSFTSGIAPSTTTSWRRSPTATPTAHARPCAPIYVTSAEPSWSTTTDVPSTVSVSCVEAAVNQIRVRLSPPITSAPRLPVRLGKEPTGITHDCLEVSTADEAAQRRRLRPRRPRPRSGHPRRRLRMAPTEGPSDGRADQQPDRGRTDHRRHRERVRPTTGVHTGTAEQ